MKRAREPRGARKMDFLIDKGGGGQAQAAADSKEIHRRRRGRLVAFACLKLEEEAQRLDTGFQQIVHRRDDQER